MNDTVQSTREFGDEIERTLESYQFQYIRDFKAGGLVFDFMVESSVGRRAVLEGKLLTSDSAQVAKRAAFLAARAKELAQANVAILVTVVPIHLPASSDVLLCTIDDLPTALSKALLVQLPGRVEPLPPSAAKSRNDVFVAMPFSAPYDDTYFVAIAGAAEMCGLAARRVDREEYVGDIVSMIKGMIAVSAVVVADLSEARPNVLYEMGLAHGLGVPVIPICSGTSADLPFDVGHENVILYELGRTSQLKSKLASRLDSVVLATNESEQRRADQEEQSVASSTGAVDDDEPGFLELLGDMESALPRFLERVQEETEVLKRLAEIGRQGTAQLELSDAQGGKMAGRISVINRIAAKLAAEADRLETTAASANVELDRIDLGIAYILESAAIDPEARSQLGILPEQVIRLSEATGRAVDSADDLAHKMAPLGRAHRSLRGPVGRIIAALKLSHRWRETTSMWAHRVHNLPV